MMVLLNLLASVHVIFTSDEYVGVGDIRSHAVCV